MSYYEDKVIAKLKETVPFTYLDTFEKVLEPLFRQTFQIGSYYGKNFEKGNPIKILLKEDWKYYEFNTESECAKFLKCTLRSLRGNIAESTNLKNYEPKKYIVIEYNHKKLTT